MTCLKDGGATIDTVISVNNGPRVFEGRTVLVDLFLGTDADWLLSIDNDIGWSHADYRKLLGHADEVDRPMVAGIYNILRPGNSMEPCVYRVKRGPLRMEPVNVGTDVPGVMKVDAAGFGFNLVHRRVFEAMRKALPDHPFPWFEETVQEGLQVGEDITFHLRAAALGFPLFVVPSVKLTHQKTVLFAR